MIVATMAAMAAVVVSLLVLGGPFVERRIRGQVVLELERGVDRAAARLRAGDRPDAVADRSGAELGVRVTVVSARGEILGDSTSTHEGAPVDAEFVRRVRLSGRARGGIAETLRVGLALEDGAVVVAQTGTAVLAAIRESVQDLLALGGLLVALGGLALVWGLSHTLVRPVRELASVARALARGELAPRTRTERADELGEIGRAIDVMADELAERHLSLRAEEARLRVVLDSMGEAVFVTDRRGVIALTNASLDRMIGDGAVGHTVPEMIRSPELHEAVNLARRGEPSAVEFETAGVTDRRALAALVTPLPAGAGVVGVIHDVTKLKHADRVRRDFVANASHELRTPLTAIRGYAETARAALDADPEAAKRFIGVILKHALRLQSLVEDLVSLSRAESPDQRFDLAPMDVKPIVLEVFHGLEGQAREKRHALAVDLPEGPAMAECNERALDQILVNLVDNAIKYTPPGGSVRVSVEAKPESVEIVVRDSGPGIAPKHLDRIFERFYRVDPGRSRDVGGTGLGLSIVRHLAQRIGAEVKVESKPGHGARFTVTLRRAAS